MFVNQVSTGHEEYIKTMRHLQLKCVYYTYIIYVPRKLEFLNIFWQL